MVAEPAHRYLVDMTSAAPLRSSPREVMPIAVFRDPTHDVTIIDVSAWPVPIDRAVLARLGDPVLVCFGDHSTLCPLTPLQDSVEVHGVVLELRDGSDEEQAFLESFTGLIDPAVPVRVLPRTSSKEIT
jgi:hypothetical protein